MSFKSDNFWRSSFCSFSRVVLEDDDDDDDFTAGAIADDEEEDSVVEQKRNEFINWADDDATIAEQGGTTEDFVSGDADADDDNKDPPNFLHATDDADELKSTGQRRIIL